MRNLLNHWLRIVQKNNADCDQKGLFFRGSLFCMAKFVFSAIWSYPYQVDSVKKTKQPSRFDILSELDGRVVFETVYSYKNKYILQLIVLGIRKQFRE